MITGEFVRRLCTALGLDDNEVDQHTILRRAEVVGNFYRAHHDDDRLGPDPFEELSRVDGHETSVVADGEGFRAKCECGWQGRPGTRRDSEFSAGYAAWAHKCLQRMSRETRER